MEIHAVRPIARGEEITVSYTTLASSAAERQSALKPYGFTCTCPACMGPEASDKERGRVLMSLLPKTSQGVKHAEAFLAAYEAAGLQALPRYTELLSRVAQINRKKGNKDRADALESLAAKVTTAHLGRGKAKPDKPEVQNFMFTSPQEAMKFMMERATDSTERANMMKAFMQVMSPDSQSQKISGPDGKDITVRMSDTVPRPKGL